MAEAIFQIDDPEHFFKKYDEANMAVIIDENVNKYHGAHFKELTKFIVPSGEQYKNIDTVEKIISFLMDRGLDRHGTIIGIGGGVVCDITGFVASIYLRGINFGFLPTTLLAMCDASIGGKNGVNFGETKNMIGLINQPGFIACYLPFLNTLPDAEYLNGMAEVIKHALLDNRSFMEFLTENHEKIKSRDSLVVQEMVFRSQAIKEGIVKKDLYEKNERKKLNLGHTIGHAIESSTRLAHGRSISIGMVMAAEISYRMGICNESFVEEVKELIQLFGLPVNAKMDHNMLTGHIKFDKKRHGKMVDFVMPKEPGQIDIILISFDDLIDHLKTILYG